MAQETKTSAQTKPDWITAEEWKAVPNVGWWEDVRVRKESIARQKPATKEEAMKQFARLRNERNWSQGE